MALTEVNSLGIKALEVKTADIAADAVTGAKIADDQINSEHYVAASIDHEHLANDCVDGDNIADDSIGAEHIADNAVGLAAMAHGTDGNLITYDASGAPAHVTTGTSGQVLTSNGAGAAPTFQAAASGAIGRNLLYNGEMQIAQRATSLASSTTSHGYQTVDRWKVNINTGAFTFSQDNESPNGFSKSLKLDCTTAASAGAAENISIQQHLEGLDLQGIKAGTSDAEALTLSFWVRATKTGVFNTILYQKDGGKFAVQNTTISSANTWEKKTFTVAGNTADAIDNDNTKAFTVEFWLSAGTNYRGGTISGSWNAWADNEAGEGVTLNIADNTSNDFYITGVKLEMGSSATDYDYQAFQDELRRCQRYYQQVGTTTQDGQFCIGASHLTSAGDQTRVGYFGQNNLRTTPSITEFGDGLRVIGSSSNTPVTGISDINVTFPSAYLQFNAECTDIGDDNEIVVVTNTANGGIKIDAEL